MKIAALIPSAGNGLRMGGKTRKQYIHIRGRPIAAHTLLTFQALEEIDKIILIAPEGDLAYCAEEIVSKYHLSKVTRVVAGGRQRQDSVYNGIRELDGDEEIVIVHDGVRPFVTGPMIRESIRVAMDTGAAITAIPVKDTLKSVSGTGTVESTIDRKKLWQVQTPQTFRARLLRAAYDKAQTENFYGTDDASLVERLGVGINVISGSALNIKVTTPEDLILAEGIIKHRENAR